MARVMYFRRARRDELRGLEEVGWSVVGGHYCPSLFERIALMEWTGTAPAEEEEMLTFHQGRCGICRQPTEAHGRGQCPPPTKNRLTARVTLSSEGKLVIALLFDGCYDDLDGRLLRELMHDVDDAEKAARDASAGGLDLAPRPLIGTTPLDAPPGEMWRVLCCTFPLLFAEAVGAAVAFLTVGARAAEKVLEERGYDVTIVEPAPEPPAPPEPEPEQPRKRWLKLVN